MGLLDRLYDLGRKPEFAWRGNYQKSRREVALLNPAASEEALHRAALGNLIGMHYGDLIGCHRGMSVHEVFVRAESYVSEHLNAGDRITDIESEEGRVRSLMALRNKVHRL